MAFCKNSYVVFDLHVEVLNDPTKLTVIVLIVFSCYTQLQTVNLQGNSK